MQPSLSQALLFADDDVLEHLVIPHHRTELLLEGVPCNLVYPVNPVKKSAAEASEPESDADFVHKLKVARKELKETRVWLRFAGKLLRDPFIEEIEAETVEIARRMGASMRKRGCSGWTST